MRAHRSTQQARAPACLTDTLTHANCPSYFLQLEAVRSQGLPPGLRLGGRRRQAERGPDEEGDGEEQHMHMGGRAPRAPGRVPTLRAAPTSAPFRFPDAAVVPPLKTSFGEMQRARPPKSRLSSMHWRSAGRAGRGTGWWHARGATGRASACRAGRGRGRGPQARWREPPALGQHLARAVGAAGRQGLPRPGQMAGQAPWVTYSSQGRSGEQRGPPGG